VHDAPSTLGLAAGQTVAPPPTVASLGGIIAGMPPAMARLTKAILSSVAAMNSNHGSAGVGEGEGVLRGIASSGGAAEGTAVVLSGTEVRDAPCARWSNY
jgi:hypothetical protein